LAVLRQSAEHFLLSSPEHLSHSAAHFSHALAQSAQTVFTSFESDSIAFIAFSQAAMHSLLVFVHEDILESFPHDFSQPLQDSMQLLQDAIHSLYLSLLIAIFVVFAFAEGTLAAIVINPIAANNKINFFILNFFKLFDLFNFH
jgi:hypothetical protein